MLFAAYSLLGLKMKEGKLLVTEGLFKPKGPLALKRLSYKGKEYTAQALGKGPVSG